MAARRGEKNKKPMPSVQRRTSCWAPRQHRAACFKPSPTAERRSAHAEVQVLLITRKLEGALGNKEASNIELGRNGTIARRASATATAAATTAATAAFVLYQSSTRPNTSVTLHIDRPAPPGQPRQASHHYNRALTLTSIMAEEGRAEPTLRSTRCICSIPPVSFDGGLFQLRPSALRASSKVVRMDSSD